MKQANLILAVDCSSSMKGASIGAVNDAALNILQMFESMVAPSGVKATVSTMVIKDKTHTSDCAPIQGYTWNDVSSDGLTSFTDFFSQLNKLMEEDRPGEEFLIVLFSDGASTDDYTSSFNKLLSTKNFHNAIKASVAVCKDYDDFLLEAFCGSPNRVYSVNDIERIEDLISCFCT